MKFAVWKYVTGTVTQTKGELLTPNPPLKQPFRHPLVRAFIVDVPEGTTREDIIKKLSDNAIQIGEADEFEAEDKWPVDVTAAFQTHKPECLSWPNLK